MLPFVICIDDFGVKLIIFELRSTKPRILQEPEWLCKTTSLFCHLLKFYPLNFSCFSSWFTGTETYNVWRGIRTTTIFTIVISIVVDSDVISKKPNKIIEPRTYTYKIQIAISLWIQK